MLINVGRGNVVDEEALAKRLNVMDAAAFALCRDNGIPIYDIEFETDYGDYDFEVAIADGRIVGAGCMLPLSSNVNLSRDLGMRHRAGIGMSEHSDAVVVIVSEETGSISAAMGGMLKRHLAPETLERLLRNELLPEEAEEEKNLNLSGLLSNLISRGKKEGEE